MTSSLQTAKTPRMNVLVMTLNNLIAKLLNTGALGNAECFFIDIAHRSTLARTGSIWESPIYGSVVWKLISVTLLTQTILLHASVYATRLLSTHSRSLHDSFYNTWQAYLHRSAESLHFFTRDKQIQKRPCVAILAFFVKRLNCTKRSHTLVR